MLFVCTRTHLDNTFLASFWGSFAFLFACLNLIALEQCSGKCSNNKSSRTKQCALQPILLGGKFHLESARISPDERAFLLKSKLQPTKLKRESRESARENKKQTSSVLRLSRFLADSVRLLEAFYLVQ